MVSIVKLIESSVTGDEPAWEIARLFPNQGTWDEGDYLALHTNHLVELTDGCIEVLPMPKPPHQRIVKFLSRKLEDFTSARKLGEVLFAPLKVRIRKNKFREPDIVFMSAEHADRKTEDFWQGADLVIEIVSDDRESYERDYKKKVEDYAEARVPEYWIVDPQERQIRVLRLDEQGNYAVHGDFKPGHQATSVLLADFSVDVGEVLDAANVG